VVATVGGDEDCGGNGGRGEGSDGVARVVLTKDCTRTRG
jgi:hypothetical protein